MAGEWLAEIDGVKGVRSSFVCDTEGHLIAGSLLADVEEGLGCNTSRELALTVAALARVVGEVGELDIAGDTTRVVVRVLAIGLLGAVCKPEVDIAMLRLMLNVAATRLRDDSALLSRLEQETMPGDVAADLDEISRQLLQALDGKEA